MKGRYEFVDLMKGICILLVIIHHLVGRTAVSPLYFTMFRMPLYFMLSGIFFSQYGCFREFLIKKFNTLLVPFCFTWILVRLHTGLHFGNWQMNIINYNVSIWFLMALFELGILMYLIMLLPREWMRCSVVIVISIIGYILSQTHTMLPMWWNAVLCATIFYYVGLQARKLRILDNRPWRYDALWLALSLGIFITLVVLYPRMYIDLRNNKIFASYPVYLLSALSGTGIVFFASKLIKYVPLLSYYGRYSVVALCTHIFIYRMLNEYGVMRFIQSTLGISNREWVTDKLGAWICMAVVALITLPIVWLCVRHIPFLVSQTPLLDPKTGKLYNKPRTLLRILFKGAARTP